MIAAIVLVTTMITAGCIALAGFATARLAGGLPIHDWVWLGIALDALCLYAIFDRRAPIWGRIVSRGRPRSPAVAITFDDGPTEPYTSQILDVLRASGTRATFFMLGARADAAHDVVRRAAREGHEIANHTWDHAALPLRTGAAIRDSIRRTSDLVETLAGRRPRVFRAPFGWRNPWSDRAARREGCETVAWTVGVYDTARPGVDAIVTRSIDGLVDGSILLLHDGRSLDPEPDASQVVAALPRILDEAKRRGLRCLTISEMLDETRDEPVRRSAERAGG